MIPFLRGGRWRGTALKTLALGLLSGSGWTALPADAVPLVEEYFDTQSDWYDQNQVQQVRNGWTLWSAQGRNPLGNPNGVEPWNDWALPEALFRWKAFLPEHEWADLLNERGYAYKIFAANRAWHFRLSAPEMILGPGEYWVSLKFFCDTYTWEGRKVAPANRLAFESRLNLGSQQGPWTSAHQLAPNVVARKFTFTAPESGSAGFEMRGRWALNNVGAFVHWFRVERLGTPANRPPSARFTRLFHPGPPPRDVSFDATLATDPDRDPLLVRWDFGDGVTDTGERVTHTFFSAGAHEVACTVLDGKGGVDVARATIEIAPSFGWKDDRLTNGDFSDGLNGWRPWVERGEPMPTPRDGGAVMQSGNHNGGLWQSFDTGGPGTTLTVDGVWAAIQPLPRHQWAEVLILNSARTPVNGQDLQAGDPDVILLFKNDTWTSPGGWRGFLSDTAPVRRQLSFTATGPSATIVLKSGNLGGAVTGTFFDDLLVRPADLPQDGDRDGLDDAWELRHFRNLRAEGWQDADGDGHTNLEEWQADTVPSDPASVLRLLGLEFERAPAMFRLRWQGGEQARQIVEQRSWTGPATWTPVWIEEPPTPVTNSALLEPREAGACLRLRAEWP